MACRLCGLNHPGWVNCRIAAKAAVVNVVVNIPSDKPEMVVNARPETDTGVVNSSRKKDRHKKVRTEYFREYMKVVRAVKAGRAMWLNKGVTV